MENKYELCMQDYIHDAGTALAELAEATREMIADDAKGNANDIRRNCETICTGLRDLAAALRDL